MARILVLVLVLVGATASGQETKNGISKAVHRRSRRLGPTDYQASS